MKKFILNLGFFSVVSFLFAQPGSFDITFTNQYCNLIYGVGVQSDGKVIFGGYTLATVGGNSVTLRRFLPDGTPDHTFTANPGEDVFAVVVQPDDKIIVAGNFASKIIRYNPDGTVDPTFIGAGKPNGAVKTITLQPDGKILIGGEFTTYDGNQSMYFARLNTDGSFDDTFQIGNLFNNYVKAIYYQNDGKILCGGSFTLTGHNYIVRLNNDATVDNSFIAPVINANVWYITEHEPGIYLVAGQFGKNLARLYSDGSLDNAFNSNIGTGFSATPTKIIVQPNKKILVCGYFSTFNGNNKAGILRLHPDGQFDSSFNPGNSGGGSVYAMIEQTDKKIIIGGSLPSYNGNTTCSNARINNCYEMYYENIVACNSFMYNGNNYFQSGQYIFNFLDINGCDSTVVLNLTINNGTSNTITETACNSYTLNGQTYTQSGTYTQTLTNVSGCDSIITLNLTINTVDVTVTDNSPTLTANAATAEYQWIDCNDNFQIIPNATNQSFTSTTSGSYAVIVTQNGCTDTSECVNVTISNLMQNTTRNGITIYPNPTQSHLYVDMGDFKENVMVTLKNSLGQVILNKTVTDSKTLYINLPDDSGIFFLEIILQDNRTIFKVTKE